MQSGSRYRAGASYFSVEAVDLAVEATSEKRATQHAMYRPALGRRGRRGRVCRVKIALARAPDSQSATIVGALGFSTWLSP